ncbi:ATP-binding protein [Radicibacter daui]|uniref:ATP-binding protein n=1 Tax=Radicibacter daui TaxID=3064829 RepID=UPI004046BB23
MRRWWWHSLNGQIISLMLAALIIGQTAGFALSWSSRNSALKVAAQSEFISRTATLCDVADGISGNLRRDVLLASATAYTRFWTSVEDPREAGRDWYTSARAYLLEPLSNIIHYRLSPTDPVSEAHSAQLVEKKAFAGWSPLETGLWTCQSPASVLPFEGQIGMGLAAQLSDGSWLNAVFYKRHQPDTGLMASLSSTLLIAAILCLAGFTSAQRIARPLRALTAAARSLGRGEVLPALPESGPSDIRDLHVAFNQMQERLHRFVADRTRMLAAIGHDLRTPLTTLRLRAELLPDTDLKEKIIRTLDEMQQMTEASLNFARTEAINEPTRNIELGALLASLCDDLAELGLDVDYIDTGKLSYRCRPDAIRRAVRNLIENAARYAGKARVSLAQTRGYVEIRVDDQGPGIPEDQFELVFSPFYRLEHSRNLQTGGIGLGLSIARAIARQHGGDITLIPNNPGLRAVFVLPHL